MLPHSKVEIDTGVLIVISPLVTQRHPDVWGCDAELFLPDRWDALDVAAVTRECKFFPFIVGIRNCIGKDFALQEIGICLAVMVRRFRLKWKEGQEMPTRVQGVTMKPGEKTYVDVEKR